MKTNCFSFLRRLLSDERGQSMVWVGVSLTALLGLSGLTLDVGHAYVVRSQLQSVVNAAALTGVGGLPSASNAQGDVSSFEAKANNPNWGTVTSPPATVKCLDALLPTGQSCSGALLNAVQVTESVNVPTFFMRIFGYTTLPVAATATATPAEARPWIVEIILDTTPSMGQTDTNCGTKGNSVTAEECALQGIQGMLGKLNPCPPGVKSCDFTNANIRFGLMSFPNIQTTDAPDNYSTCSGSINFQPYSTPVPPVAGSTAPYTYLTYTGASTLNLTYLSTYGASDMDQYGFYTNWYSSTTKSGLNPSSTLVQAIGRSADSVNPCLREPNVTHSEVTSFAQVIYAAQTNLIAEQVAHPIVNNLPTHTAIVFLSDGQANALAQDYPADGNAVSSPSGSSTGMNVNGKTQLNSNLATPTGMYPSGIDACQQAITAAQYAASQGTRVYTVAYGSEVGGCLYYAGGTGGFTSTVKTGTGGSTNTGIGSDIDQTSGSPLVSSGSPLIVTGTLNVPMTSITDVVPCNVITNMASDLAYFYSDANQELSGGASGLNAVDLSCTSKDNPTLTSLSDIFQGIYGSLTSARLIPNAIFTNSNN